MKKMKKKGPQNTQKTRKKGTKIKKTSVSLVLRSGATPQSSILCVLWALYSSSRQYE